MGKPFFIDPVDYISGKISRKYHTCYYCRKASNHRYTSVPGKRTTQPAPDEINHRLKFAIVRQAAIARSEDLSRLTADQHAHAAEKKAQGANFKYSTYIGWLFGKAWQYFDENSNAVVWPQNL